MLTRSQSKYIRSLALQKFREEHQAYVLEGEKMVAEYLRSQHSFQLCCVTDKFIGQHKNLLEKHSIDKIITVTEKELSALSKLQQVSQALLVAPMIHSLTPTNLQEWHLVLDGIRDPGNMGTIIRTADWFGIKHVFATDDCVSFYNPKVIQAAMGSHLRVAYHIIDAVEWLSQTGLQSYAASLQGTNIFSMEKAFSPGAIVMGNESKGIRDEVLEHCSYNLSIPGAATAESLNVSVATGIICAVLIASN